MPPANPPSGALSIDRVHGRDVVAVINGQTLTNWEKISIKPMIGKFGKNAANATFEQKTKGRRDCTGNLSFILGGANVPANMPAPGDEITSLTFTITANGNLLPANLADHTVYGKCRVMSTPYELQDAPGTFTIDIEWGFVD